MFQVDGDIIAERTAIAQAIPSNGSLWLGCRPRDPPPGPNLGNVELYLFRMWADFGAHGPCEDGTVIGWNAKYWGVTSPSARQIDPSLMCGEPDMKEYVVTGPNCSRVDVLILTMNGLPN